MRVTSIRRIDATHYSVSTDCSLSDGTSRYACDWMHITDGSYFADGEWRRGPVLAPHYDGSGIFPPSATFRIPLSHEKLAELRSMPVSE